MVRVDIWDVQKPEDTPPIVCGFSSGFAERYELGQTLGKGGFGKVQVVTERITGREYACKSIAKRLDVPNLSPQKQAAYLDNIRREVLVLQKLKGVLSVAQLKETLEDDTNIYIIMEYCRGGELLASLGKRHYSEATVASYMRAVLRTLVQCHANRILHRDIKPGNFMLLDNHPLSAVKAIDFGLAVFYEPGSLPRKDLGLEGTPWFMSPEMLSSEVGPPTDVWAAGVMAFQLLSGYLPFDDHKNRESPALSKVWRAILTEDVSFKGKYWEEVPDAAKDFIKQLLNKDPQQRPTAKQALQHEWLKDRHKADRASGPPLDSTVVQRIQRYGQGNVIKRSILELIAAEIIRMVPDTPDVTNHGPLHARTNGDTAGGIKREAEDPVPGTGYATVNMLSSFKRRKSRRELHLTDEGPGGGAMEGPPLVNRGHHSSHGGMEYFQVRGESVHRGRNARMESDNSKSASVHGARNYWGNLRKFAGGADQDYSRQIARNDMEREEQQKVARLAMDTSKHEGKEYISYVRHFSSPNLMKQKGANQSRESVKPGAPSNSRNLPRSQSSSERRNTPKEPPKQLFPFATPSIAEESETGGRVRGQHAYMHYKHRSSGSSGLLASSLQRHSMSNAIDSPCGSVEGSFARSSSLDIPQRNANSLDLSRNLGSTPDIWRESSVPDLPGMPRVKKVSFGSLGNSLTNSGLGTPGNSQHGSRSGSQHGAKAYWEHLQTDSSTHTSRDSTHAAKSPRGPNKETKPENANMLDEVRSLMRRLNFSKEVEGVSEDELAEGLRNLGYRLRPEEMSILAQQVDPQAQSGGVSKYAFLASQIDWHRDDLRELWIEAAKRVFQGFETQLGGNKFSYAMLTDMIRHKIPEKEIEYALEDALVAGGYADEEELDFEGFMRLLKADKVQNLAYFESRLPKSREASQTGLVSEALKSSLYMPGSSPGLSSGLPSVAEH